MNTRKIKKALSPVIATIILIAVTVAVGLAVAAWMGALTFSFMGSSSLTITKVTFSDVNGVANQGSGNSNNTIILSIKNTGTKTVTVGTVKINNALVSPLLTNSTMTYAAAATGTIELQNVDWSNGNAYQFNLFDSSNNGVGAYQQSAPS